MVKVHILSSELIKPSASAKHIPSDELVIESCNLDLVILNVYIKTVYFYTPQETRSLHDFFSPAVLKSSLAEALAIYYPMAGRLVRRGDRCIEIVCNDAGALFVQAYSRSSLHDLGTFVPKPDFLSLVPSLDAFPDEASQPLFTVQVTKFSCGGIALGIGVEHHVADGLSAIAFLNAWAAFAKGDLVKCKPCFDKVWLKARKPPIVQYPHLEYTTLPPKPHINSLRPLPSVEMIDIPKEFVQELKQQNYTQDIKPFSTYELLASHIWRCVCKARNLPSNQKTMLVTLVDGRSRLKNPSLPDHFFGNVIFTSCPTDYAGTIMDCDLMHTASIVQKALRQVDDAYCRSAIDFLEMQTDFSKFVKGAHTFASPNLGLISWTQLPMYETNFGWGKPIYVGPAFIPWEGHAYLLTSPSTHGSFRLFITLKSEHMPKFKELILHHNHH